MHFHINLLEPIGLSVMLSEMELLSVTPTRKKNETNCCYDLIN